MQHVVVIYMEVWGVFVGVCEDMFIYVFVW